MKRFGLAFGISLLAGACAQSYQPVIDARGVDYGKYQQDLAECRRYAEQVDPTRDTLVGTGIGALIGAAGGAAIGAAAGNAGTGAAIGAAAGGIGGGASQGIRAGEDQKTIINNCLRNRGYAVLR